MLGFSYMRIEARATVDLKIMLNQFQCVEDQQRFENCIKEVLKELSRQIAIP